MALAYLRGRNLHPADVAAWMAAAALSQRDADSARELVDKISTCSLSNLARLSDDVFAAGLSTAERAAPGLNLPIDERLDLVVFTATKEH
jgi:hypothetical protein